MAPLRRQAARNGKAEASLATADPDFLEIMAIVIRHNLADGHAVIEDAQQDRRVWRVVIMRPSADIAAQCQIEVAAKPGSRRRNGFIRERPRPRRDALAHRFQFLAIFHARGTEARRYPHGAWIERLKLVGVVEHPPAVVVQEGFG